MATTTFMKDRMSVVLDAKENPRDLSDFNSIINKFRRATAAPFEMPLATIKALESFFRDEQVDTSPMVDPTGYFEANLIPLVFICKQLPIIRGTIPSEAESRVAIFAGLTLWRFALRIETELQGHYKDRFKVGDPYTDYLQGARKPGLGSSISKFGSKQFTTVNVGNRDDQAIMAEIATYFQGQLSFRSRSEHKSDECDSMIHMRTVLLRKGEQYFKYANLLYNYDEGGLEYYSFNFKDDFLGDDVQSLNCRKVLKNIDLKLTGFWESICASAGTSNVSVQPLNQALLTTPAGGVLKFLEKCDGYNISPFTLQLFTIGRKARTNDLPWFRFLTAPKDSRDKESIKAYREVVEKPNKKNGLKLNAKLKDEAKFSYYESKVHIYKKNKAANTLNALQG